MKVFDAAEFTQRLTRTQARMRDRGLDALLVTTPENIYYLSGYCGWSFYTTQALIVSPTAPQPILVLRDMDVACARFSAYLDERHVIGYSEEYVGGALHAMTFIANVVRAQLGHVQRVGVEKSGFFMPVADFEALQTALPGVELADSGRLVNWLRTVKSPAEIDAIRTAGSIADLAIQTAYERIEPGVRECDVAAELLRTLTRGTEHAGGTEITALSLTSGAKTSAPHLGWSDERFVANTSVNLELGGSRYHYHAGLARSLYLGSPPAALTELATVVRDGMDAALDAARPGIECQAIEREWRRVLNAAGYEKKSRIGYSIGIGFQPTWLDVTASLQEGDRTVLEPGMTFHMICGMWKGAANYVASETFAVTASGCELLTRYPRQLLIKR